MKCSICDAPLHPWDEVIDITLCVDCDYAVDSMRHPNAGSKSNCKGRPDEDDFYDDFDDGDY